MKKINYVMFCLKKMKKMNYMIFCGSTEGSHVKTNLVYTLYWVQKYGLLPMAKFEEMMRPSEKKRCTIQPPRV